MTPGIQELMREVERVRDGFRRAVLAGEPDAAVALCAEAVTLIDLPVDTGAAGRDDLRRHLAEVAAHRGTRCGPHRCRSAARGRAAGGEPAAACRSCMRRFRT